MPPSLLPKLASLGTSIPTIIQPTFGLYTPLLIANAPQILSTPRKTFSYGSHPRQTLDVYFPPAKGSQSTSSTTSTTPTSNPQSHTPPTKVLIFAHGGGLVSGSRRLPIPNRSADEGLVYANLGSFFAKRGIVTVVMNYRLVAQHGQGQGAVWPSGGVDVGLVVAWVGEHVKELGGGKGGMGVEVCLMGNSAGGVHVGTWCLGEGFEEGRRMVRGMEGNVRVGKVVFLATPTDFEAAGAARGDVLREYYGERQGEDCVLGLLKKVIQRAGKAFEGMEVLVLTGSLDPEDEILAPNKRMVEEMKRGDGLRDRMRVEVLEGHNHISPVTALGSGCEEDEEWGRRVVDFITKDD